MYGRRIIRKAAAIAAGLAVLAEGRAAAQAKSVTLSEGLQQVKNTFTSTNINLIADIVSGIVFVTGIILVGWGYAARGRGDGQSNDKMINAGIYALIATAMIQIFKALAGGS